MRHGVGERVPLHGFQDLRSRHTKRQPPPPPVGRELLRRPLRASRWQEVVGLILESQEYVPEVACQGDAVNDPGVPVVQDAVAAQLQVLERLSDLPEEWIDPLAEEAVDAASSIPPR